MYSHEDLHARLVERLQPTALEVIDESAAHAGHAGPMPRGAAATSGCVWLHLCLQV